MDKEQENISTENTTVPLYPEPTKGTLADDHSNYGKDVTFVGGDPDKQNKAFFIGFMIFIGLLFIFAIKALSGESFFF